MDKGTIVEVLGCFLLFLLVFGMSATVEVQSLQAQMFNHRAMAAGLFLQFVVMPFLGFLCVKCLRLDYITGVILLVVTASPGGSYSNWFCSLFNADLALSVAMTAVTTMLSVVMLPLNLYIYTQWAYQNRVSEFMRWHAVAGALAIVIFSILAGLAASYMWGSTKFRLLANRLGNVTGVLLIIFSMIVSNANGSHLWDHGPEFYVGVALPCVLGLIVATGVTHLMKLRKPEGVTVSVECCIQNTGIAVSVALTMFEGEDLGMATAVPLYYGITECVIVCLYCIYAWKQGWTKAPADMSFGKMLTTSYEVLSSTQAAEEQESDFYYVDHREARAEGGDHIPMTDKHFVKADRGEAV